MFVHNNSKHGRRARRLDPSEGTPPYLENGRHIFTSYNLLRCFFPISFFFPLFPFFRSHTYSSFYIRRINSSFNIIFFFFFHFLSCFWLPSELLLCIDRKYNALVFIIVALRITTNSETLCYFYSGNAPTFVLKATVKHDQIAEEFGCKVNFLPLEFCRFSWERVETGGGRRKTEREKGGRGRSTDSVCVCVWVGGCMEGWGGLWAKQNLLFFFQLIPYDRLIAFSAKREKRRTTKPWEIRKVKCAMCNLSTHRKAANPQLKYC